VRHTPRIIFLTMCSVPVAFGVNILRTVGVAIIAYHFEETASQIAHHASGFATFPIAIAIMFQLAKKSNFSSEKTTTFSSSTPSGIKPSKSIKQL
jgi:exosortase/archaeosortase family protein